MTKPVVRIKKITDYTPDPANANQGTERGWRMVNDSMEEDGAGRSIVVAADNTIVAGNKTTENAVDVGITEVIEIETDGHQLVVVKRTDWESIDDPSARRYAYRDNRAGELSLSWNAEQLLADLKNEKLPEGLFTDDELSDILSDLLKEEPKGDPGEQLDRATELVKKFGIERGQIWQIGRHRLMCGDSYSDEQVALLLSGTLPDLLHTDPPYGISIVKPRKGELSAADGGAKPFGGTSGTKRKSGAAERSAREQTGFVHGKASKNQLAINPEWPIMKGDNVGRSDSANIVQSNLYPVIEGDDRPFNPLPFLDLAPIIVLWGANNYADKLPISQGWIVWDKREDITRNTFADCELAWTNQRRPARLFHHLWNGLHKGSQHGERRTHPTEKPVALFSEIGKMLCPHGIWLDLFAGTGSQIVAAEQCNTVCYAMEYEPLYIATTLQRLADMGLEPRLVA